MCEGSLSTPQGPATQHVKLQSSELTPTLDLELIMPAPPNTHTLFRRGIALKQDQNASLINSVVISQSDLMQLKCSFLS